MSLLHEFINVKKAFKHLHEIDQLNFEKIEDLFLLHSNGLFKLYVLVSTRVVWIEPRHFTEWIYLATERDRLYEESRTRKIETPADRQARHTMISTNLNEVKVKINELQNYVSTPPPSNHKTSLPVEIARIQRVTGRVVVNVDSVDYFLINDVYKKSNEAIDVYTKDNSTIGFFKNDFNELLKIINRPEQKEKNVEISDEYEKYTSVELVPRVMESLGLIPLAYTLEVVSKKDIYLHAKHLYEKKFRMSFNSFSRGGNSTWHKTKKAGLIKEAP